MVAKGEPTPVVPRCEGLPNGSEHRSMDRATSFVRACLYVSLRVFTVMEREVV
jgi:hypothetical protein